MEDKAMKQCPNCLHEEDDSYTYCSKCGTKLTETENEKAAEIKTEKKQKEDKNRPPSESTGCPDSHPFHQLRTDAGSQPFLQLVFSHHITGDECY